MLGLRLKLILIQPSNILALSRKDFELNGLEISKNKDRISSVQV